MSAQEAASWDTGQDAGPLPSRRRRWLAVAGAAVAALVIVALATWMFRSPAYQKFCAGGGAVDAPVRATS